MTTSSRYQKMILAGLQSMPIYAGTVDPKVIAKRRAANRRAKASRRKNRGR